MQVSSALEASPSVFVLLVEDQTALREMLAASISLIPGFKVVGECSNVEEALRLTETLRPALVVLDWMLNDGTGLQYLTSIKGRAHCPRVLVFSGNTTRLVVQEALAAGATGFIEKTARLADVVAALRVVATGRSYLGPATADVVKAIVRSPSETRIGATISGREREILRMVAAGLTSKEIADRLGISLRTVNSHRAAIIRKTGLHSVAALTRHAYEIGLMGDARMSQACA